MTLFVIFQAQCIPRNCVFMIYNGVYTTCQDHTAYQVFDQNQRLPSDLRNVSSTQIQ